MAKRWLGSSPRTPNKDTNSIEKSYYLSCASSSRKTTRSLSLSSAQRKVSLSLSTSPVSLLTSPLSIAFEVEASSTEECSTWIQLLIELKTAKALHVQRVTQCVSQPIRVIKFWQIDTMVGSVRLAKYSIADSSDHDLGIISMEDLVPVEDDVGFENYRDSLSMSSLGPTNSVSFDRTASLTFGIRSRGDSSLPPATASTRINSNMRSKSMTASTLPSPQVFNQEEKAAPVQVFDIFAGEMLVPSSEPLISAPPKLHTVWSAEFEEGEGNRRSFPRSASSPNVRSSLGMAELTNHDQVDRSSGPGLPQSREAESAFLAKTSDKNIPTPQTTRGNGSSSTVPPPPPSFAEDDDLFDFLTSDTTNRSAIRSSAAPFRQMEHQQAKKMVLDQDKYILHRK
jgi:hypothetical protein